MLRVGKPSPIHCYVSICLMCWPQHANFEDQCWLCGELVVPKKTSCSIFVPSHQGSCLVTDKMGQSMFRTSRAARFVASV